MIDRKWIGHAFEPMSVDVERGRLRQFAKAIAETRPEYADPQAARARGWRDIPVPPTFLFCLEMERPDPWDYLEVLGVPLSIVLHAEQSFNYHEMVYAGDTLIFQNVIADITDKRDGALEFVTKATKVMTGGGTPVADLQTVLVVRNQP